MPYNSFSQWVLYFTLYSVFGWICETVWCSVPARKWVSRGFLSGPYCPIYGFGAVIIILIASPVRQWPILVFLIALVSTTLLEYFTGWLLEALFKTKWWDYSSYRFQYKGRVCLLNSILFGLLGLGAIYLFQPAVAWMVALVSPESQRVLASILIVIFFLDLVRSLGVAANLQERLAQLKDITTELSLYEKEYNWFDLKDITGSIARLREVCAEQEENETANHILERIDALSIKRRSPSRLMSAFPNLQSREYPAELAALKDEWALRTLRSKEKAKALAAQTKVKAQQKQQDMRSAYKGITLTRMVWVFLIGSVIGFVVETIYCYIARGVIESRQGMLYGPFSQIYGFGAVAMVLLLTGLARLGDGWLFIGGAVVGGLFETVSSLFQEAVFKSRSWEYSGQRFSFFGGRTSLLYMFFWGILAVFYMKWIYPRMAMLIDKVPKRPKRFFTWVIAVTLSANMLLSVVALGRWSERLAGEPPSNSVEEWIDTQYPNEFMREIYPNMHFFAEDIEKD